MAAAERTSAGAIFSVPAGVAFLEAIASAVVAGDLPRPGGRAPAGHDLSRYLILLPTRRAARSLAEAFLKASRRRALILPDIRPIGEGDEDLGLLDGLVSGGAIGRTAAEDLPPAVGAIERRLALTRLVLAWSAALRQAEDDPGPALAGPATPAQAVRFAADLGRLIDMLETEGAKVAGLDALVPDEHSEHWQQTLDFLKIIGEAWPGHLKERGLMGAAERRNRLLDAEAHRIARADAHRPVIVAGVTGSVPATARLMATVASRPAGAVVLHGLDLDLDDAAWQAISSEVGPGHPEHPQHGLARLLQRLGVARSDVRTLPGVETAPAMARRIRLVSEAMRPAATTSAWHSLVAGHRSSFAGAADGVSIIEAASPEEEAETVALILREAVETPGRTAALVSPDRLLARRVAIRLQSWGISADDSAGRPLLKTVPGTFLDLIIRAVAERFAPVATMALLKHPLTRLGMTAADARRAGRALELAVFRRPYFGTGLAGIEAQLRAARLGSEPRPARHLWEADWQRAEAMLAELAAAVRPLATLFDAPGTHPIAALVGAHAIAADAVARRPDGDESSAVWQGEAGEAAAGLFAALLDEGLPGPPLSADDYPDFWRALLAAENVRPRLPTHPRIFIWGPLEARLLKPDVVVLGSLNEGTWPEVADPGPWLNRPMRRALGLPAPEEEIGRSAHDWSMPFGAERVFLTRSTKVEGAPTVPSRWLMRLTALAQGLGLRDALETSPEPWLAWARSRDAAAMHRPVAPPRPRPPLDLRPRRMSVSDVETWIANPYAIFARRILGLDPLPPLGAAPDAALRGSIVHAALGRFAHLYPARLPDDPADALMRLAREVIGQAAGDARVAAFWLPRLARFASWFAETEPARRSETAQLLAEVKGERALDRPAGTFILTARADRIDVMADGRLVITDYKTMGASGLDNLRRRALAGRSPQLPLEAAIAEAGGFTGVAAATVARLVYISAAGSEPPGIEVEVREARQDSTPPATLAAAAVKGLEQLVAAYDDATTPYAAIRRPGFDYTYDAYGHLARVGEWSAGGEEE